ncbi:MAG: glycosyltransferase family 9 protein, partial [Gammaproteobacteria bacterium]|nr:glycosyltransferase family 9 protein [Gammaproteobacteria bacterium]
CREVARASRASPAILTGRTGLAELTALLARVTALVVNDSGPAHVAAAVGTPVVTVFGPTAPAYGYTPVGV